MASLTEGGSSSSSTTTATATLHPSFRAILTIEVPMLMVSSGNMNSTTSPQETIMPKIPEQLLQESSKALLETPTGLRNALIRSALSLDSMNDNKMERASSSPSLLHPSLRDRLLPLIVWVHATLIERRRFVPAGCGWSKSYDFCDADLTCALATVDTLVSQQGLVLLPSTTRQAKAAILGELSFLLLQAVHGARLETDADAVEFKAILDRVFKTAAIEDKSSYSLSADAAVCATTAASGDVSLVSWATSVVPDITKPSVIGLLNTAEEGLLKAEAVVLIRRVEAMI
jgi:dynein heavy chain 1